MNLKNKLKKSLLTLLGFSLSTIISCSKPPDVSICTQISLERGWCTWTISEKEQFVDNDKNLLDGKKWYEVKLNSLIIPAGSWGELKAYILKQCKKNQDCQADIGKWERKTEKIDLNIKEK